MMKPIIFTSALLLGSAIAGEALAAACPIVGQSAAKASPAITLPNNSALVKIIGFII